MFATNWATSFSDVDLISTKDFPSSCSWFFISSISEIEEVSFLLSAKLVKSSNFSRILEIWESFVSLNFARVSSIFKNCALIFSSIPELEVSNIVFNSSIYSSIFDVLLKLSSWISLKLFLFWRIISFISLIEFLISSLFGVKLLFKYSDKETSFESSSATWFWTFSLFSSIVTLMSFDKVSIFWLSFLWISEKSIASIFSINSCCNFFDCSIFSALSLESIIIVWVKSFKFSVIFASSSDVAE